MIRRKTSELLVETVALPGKRVLDVGSGDGTLTRLMARQGAHVTGVECAPRQLDKARAAVPVGDERFLEGVAQALPCPAASVDIVVFFNSLHHVPVADQPQALAEAARVLVAGGHLVVIEPLAEGNLFELVKPVDDETEVRAAAYRALKDCARFGLVEERELVFVNPVVMPDFAALRDRIVSADAQRESAFAEQAAAIEASFLRLGRRTADGWQFDQPSRLSLLRRD